ncbi:DUF3306 domain-containing protein [Vibrio agarivorans]|uniref:DUF3306 domain-containing protein n=1 Tax=Vibrio agarivorans TaxID=153622 RepID=UPI00222E9A49|nr:DUF3306 domain-containing protein [Vibrio agarivorans]MDN3660562.1 DUF3306 domain-containing protein [Vibrio agarivorans]
MASSFISRWSQRKIEESQHESKDAREHVSEQLREHVRDEKLNSEAEIVKAEPVNSVNEEAEQQSNLEREQSTDNVEDAGVAETASATETDVPQETSIANLLVSEASESIKKAALRKLFLSEEFNVRDGLDDYDDDYSNLKTLSEGVADKLRDWVNDKPEEEVSEEYAEDALLDDHSHSTESAQEPPQEANSDLLDSEPDPVEVPESNALTEDEDLNVRQNIPHKK